MITQWQHRLFISIPAAQQSAFNQFWAANVDKDGAGDKTFTVGLNASGLATDAVSDVITNTALTDPQLKSVMTYLCQLVHVTFPKDWDKWTRAQKQSWVVATAPTFAAIGIKALTLDDNDGVWSDTTATLTKAGLKPIETDIKEPKVPKVAGLGARKWLTRAGTIPWPKGWWGVVFAAVTETILILFAYAKYMGF